MRIAVIGAYGNGKTTLTTALAAHLGIPRTHGQPMRDPAGAPGRSLEDSTPPQLIQLMTRRFTERVLGETLAGAAFVSDGSIMHEWVYTTVRLAAGRFPQPPIALPAPGETPFQQVVHELGSLTRSHAAGGYDLVVHLPVEYPLTGAAAPISEHFRSLSDALLCDTLSEIGVAVHVVTGTPGERLQAVLALTGR